MERKNIAAFTESTAEAYPGYVSINRESDGHTYTITVRERGHGGKKSATLEIQDADLLSLGVGIVAETDPR